MRRILGHLVLAVFLTATWFGVQSCDRLEEAMPLSSSEVVQDDMSIPEPEALASTVEEGTLSSEIKHRRPGSDARMKPLPILRCLELTAEQREAIAGFLRSHHDCTKSIMDSLRASERPLVEAAREAHKAVREQLQAGTITREEALAQFRQIKAELQENLNNNPVREWARQALEACRQELFNLIRGILTAEQQAIWDEWVANGTIPCGPKPRDGRPKPDTTRGGRDHGDRPGKGGPGRDGHGPHDRPAPPDSTRG